MKIYDPTLDLKTRCHISFDILSSNLRSDSRDLKYLRYSDLKSLESERKFELRISNEMWQHVLRSGVGSYILHFLGTYLVYILFLLVCSNYLITLKNRRCRNLLSIDYWLNWIDPSTNIIFPPNAERGNRTKIEIFLEEVFQYSIV